MYKTITFFLLLLAILSGMQVSAQTKSTFSIGGGYENMHNDFTSAYNLHGAGLVYFNYEAEKLKNSGYKTISNINLKGSSLGFDHDFMNKLDNGPYNFMSGLSIDKNYLFNLYQAGNFNFWGGFASSIQTNFEFIVYDAIINYYSDYKFFLNFGVSGGLSASASLKLNKFNIQNTCSFILLNAMLYPNYAYDYPLYGTYIPNYFVFASVKRRQYFTNKLKVEFPLYIADKLKNSLAVSYQYNYENSSINDIVIRKYQHFFSVGLIFNLGKVDVCAQ